MSQKNSRKFQESKKEKSKQIRCQRVRNVCSNIAPGLHRKSNSGELLKASVSNRCHKEIIDNSTNEPTAGQVSDWELTGLSNCIKDGTDGQSPAGLLTSENMGVSCGCTGDVSRNPSDYSMCFDEKNYTTANEKSCERSPHIYLRKQEDCHENETNYAINQALNTNSSVKGDTVNLYSTGILNTKKLCDNSSTDQSQCCTFQRKARGSKSFHPTSEYQRLLKKDVKKDVHPKLLSQRLGLTFLRPFSNNVSIPSSGKSVAHKSHSFISIAHCSPVIVLGQHRELSIVMPDSMTMCESTQNIAFQPPIKNTYCADNKDGSKADEESNNYIHSKSEHQLNSRIKKMPSSDIQRCHEQLNVETKVNESKRKNSRVRQIQLKLTQQSRQDTGSKEHDARYMHRFKSSTRIHESQKQEKPYRQWHRVSRVVTTDSKFMINHCISSRLNANLGNIMVSEQKEVQKSAEEHKNPAVATGSELLTGLTTLPSVVYTESIDSCPQSETTRECIVSPTEGKSVCNIEIKDERKDQETKLHVSASICTISMNDGDICTKHVDSIDISDGSVDGIESSITLTDAICQHTETCNSSTATTTTTIQEADTVTDYDYVTVGTHMPVLCSPRIQKKVPLKLFQKKKNNQHKEKDNICNVGDDSVECDHIPGKRIVTMRPVSSVSGVSQVSGPSTAIIKISSSSFDHSRIATSLLKYPLLRTSNRSRNISQIPSHISVCNNLIPVDDSSSANCSDHRNILVPKANDNSRNSKHVSRNSSGFIKCLEKGQVGQHKYQIPNSCGKETFKHNRNGIGGLKTSSRNDCGSPVGRKKHSTLPIPRLNQVIPVDVDSKMMEKVSGGGLHVHWSEQTKKYDNLQAAAACKEIVSGKLTFRKVQNVKHHSCSVDRQVTRVINVVK